MQCLNKVNVAELDMEHHDGNKESIFCVEGRITSMTLELSNMGVLRGW